MNTTLWVIQWTLAVLVGVFGIFRIFYRDKESPLPLKMRLMGIFSCLVAIGLIFPVFSNTLPVIVPISASLLFLTQLQGIFYSGEDKKKQFSALNFFLLLLEAFIIYGRFFYKK